MTDQVEELIREIAAKHGIAVARDDPILVLQTINQRLLHDSTEAQRQQLKQFSEQMEAVSMRWKMDANEKAERVLTAAISHSRIAADQLLKEQVLNLEVTFESHSTALLETIRIQSQLVRRHTIINLFASCLTMTSFVIALTLLR